MPVRQGGIMSKKGLLKQLQEVNKEIMLRHKEMSQDNPPTSDYSNLIGRAKYLSERIQEFRAS